LKNTVEKPKGVIMRVRFVSTRAFRSSCCACVTLISKMLKELWKKKLCIDHKSFPKPFIKID